MPQLSLLPLSTWAAATVALPLASKFTVTFWQSAVGAVLSTTVTVAVQVLTLPLVSVTVRVTVLAPTWLQSKLAWSRLMLAMPQLSLLPLST